jgi:hypothetical protein
MILLFLPKSVTAPSPGSQGDRRVGRGGTTPGQDHVVVAVEGEVEAMGGQVLAQQHAVQRGRVAAAVRARPS